MLVSHVFVYINICLVPCLDCTQSLVVQSLEKHTKSYIKPELQDQHRHLCLQYRNASSIQEAETRYLAIKAWWASSNCTSEDGLKHLKLWLAFWHFRYLQWGGFMELVHNLYVSFMFFPAFGDSSSVGPLASKS
jgi:hypothetical protein